MPARKPSAGLLGVDGVLVVTSSPVSSSKATTSVNVPPVSMPIRIRRVMRRFNRGLVHRGHGRPCRRTADRPATSASVRIRRRGRARCRSPASSWPVSAWIAVMISSVTSRRALPSGTPSYRPATSIGSPNVTVTGTTPGQPGADRLELLGAGEADRDDRDAGGQREVGDAGAAAVEPAVAGAGALGVDAERLAAAEHLERGVEAGDRGLACRRGRPAASRCPRTTPAAAAPLTPVAGEVVGLGEEGDLARHHDRDDQGVGEAEVVAGQDHRHRCAARSRARSPSAARSPSRPAGRPCAGPCT